ncbi:MAG: hypothetical protein V4466_06495 [Pseudomonadota bacterium]
MSSFDTPYTMPPARRTGVDGLIDAAKGLFRPREEYPAPGQPRVQEFADNARVVAGNVATHLKQKPIPPALILLGVGIGLTLLFNKRARDATISAGGFAFDQYKKYR